VVGAFGTYHHTVPFPKGGRAMPLHIRHEMAVEIKHLGVLALAGTTFEINGKDEVTTVYFVLQAKLEAGLFSHIHPQPSWLEADGILFDFFENDHRWVESPTNSDTYLMFFERKVSGKLREPNKFLHAIANKLRAELIAVEEWEFSKQEAEDEIDWANEYYGSRAPMPDFKRPRHAD